MKDRGLKAASWCKRAKVSSSSLYNFLNGRSDSLSHPTLEKLAQSERATISQLIGESDETAEFHLPRIDVIGEVQAGVWRTAASLYYDEQMTMAVPVEDKYADRAFGLRVRGNSMNEHYPEGAVLVCVKLPEFDDAIVAGDHVVIHRRSGNDTVEATVKEIERDADGGWWLWPRSTDPAHQQPIRIQSPDDWDHISQGDEISVFAVVIGSYVPRKRMAKRPRTKNRMKV